jgi:RNA polymerase sigma factor (sigma-70 family)
MTDHLFRENSGKMVAVLTRLFGLNQIDTVMDAVQETFESALVSWRFSGIPQNPAGWLMQVAKNKTVSAMRRNSKTHLHAPSAFLRSFDNAASPDMDEVLSPQEVEDSQLRLLLTCCHPDFSEKNQIMLTLNILCGFGITEIAAAILMQEEAVKKALTRMKAGLKEKNTLLLTPQLPRYEKRVGVVHTILYLMFNEGYKTTRAKEMINNDLCYEAIRLSKLLLGEGVALPEETKALLALMFFNLSRFPSRLSSNGEIVTLAEQNRGKWNRVFIEEGFHYLSEATRHDTLSHYHLEAIISSLHCAATSFDKTDWATIVHMYQQLETLVSSPMVSLNKIVAESYLHNPAFGLEQIDLLKKNQALQNYYLLYAAEGDMLLRQNNAPLARLAFSKAYKLAISPLDKQFLENKMEQC